MTSTTHNGTGPPMPVAATQPPASPNGNGNGNGNGHVVPAPAAGWVEAGPAARRDARAAAAAGDRVADVMLHYHQVMQQFLETERSVMLGYLGAARQDPGSRSAAPLSSRVALAPLAAATPMPQLAAPARGRRARPRARLQSPQPPAAPAARRGGPGAPGGPGRTRSGPGAGSPSPRRPGRRIAAVPAAPAAAPR